MPPWLLKLLRDKRVWTALSVAYEFVKRFIKRKPKPQPKVERKPMDNPLKALADLKGKLLQKAGLGLVSLLIGQLDSLMALMYGQLPEAKARYARIAARNVLEFEPELRRLVLETPTDIDDKFVDEVLQFAREVDPDYQPVPLAA